MIDRPTSLLTEARDRLQSLEIDSSVNLEESCLFQALSSRRSHSAEEVDVLPTRPAQFTKCMTFSIGLLLM